MSDFRRDFDRLFDEWSAPARRELRTESHFVPACDVEEQDDHYLLTLEVAGVKKDDIKMEVVDNQILISGERRNERRKKTEGGIYSERRFGKFQRAFALPAGVDAVQVEASFQDGVLHILVPKAETAKPRQIKITNGGFGSKFFDKFLNQSKEKEDQNLSRVTDKSAS
jgi:HSP20 family protein